MSVLHSWELTQHCSQRAMFDRSFRTILSCILYMTHPPVSICQSQAWHHRSADSATCLEGNYLVNLPIRQLHCLKPLLSLHTTFSDENNNILHMFNPFTSDNVHCLIYLICQILRCKKELKYLVSGYNECI